MSTVDTALMLLSVGRPEEALQKLREEFDAGNPWCWYVRAEATLRLERLDDCVDACERGLALDPEHIALLDVLATARMRKNDLAGAEEAILNALRLDADDPDLLSRYAHIVARAGQTEKATKLVERAMNIDPTNEYALQMHALLAAASGDPRQTIARARELLMHGPEAPLGHHLIGAMHAERGRIDDAHEAYRTAITLDPSDENVAESVREIRLYRHWLMWPLRPALRIGNVPMWLGAVTIMLVLRALKLNDTLTWFSILWVAYCVYSWVVPSIARRLVNRL